MNLILIVNAAHFVKNYSFVEAGLEAGASEHMRLQTERQSRHLSHELGSNQSLKSFTTHYFTQIVHLLPSTIISDQKYPISK